VGFLARAELGFFTAEPAFGFRDLHAFAGPGADEVGFEFRDHGQDVEKQPAHGVGGVVDGSAEAELHLPLGEILDDVPGVRQGSGEAVEFGYDEGVAGADRCKGLAKTRPFLVSAGQTMVDVDPVFGDAQDSESVALGGKVLLIGRNAGVI